MKIKRENSKQTEGNTFTRKLLWIEQSLYWPLQRPIPFPTISLSTLSPPPTCNCSPRDNRSNFPIFHRLAALFRPLLLPLRALLERAVWQYNRLCIVIAPGAESRGNKRVRRQRVGAVFALNGIVHLSDFRGGDRGRPMRRLGKS